MMESLQISPSLLRTQSLTESIWLIQPLGDRETESMNMERIIIKVVKSKQRLRLRGTTVLVCCNLLDDDKVLAGLVFQNLSDYESQQSENLPKYDNS